MRLLWIGLALLATVWCSSVITIKGKHGMKHCYHGVFLRNTKASRDEQTIQQAKGCSMMISYKIQRVDEVPTGDPDKPTRRKYNCLDDSAWGEMRAVPEEDLTQKWAELPGDETETEITMVVEPQELNYGEGVELEDDRAARLVAEAAGNVTKKPSKYFQRELEPSILEPHCISRPGTHQGQLTCYCFTDFCNRPDGENIMFLLMLECTTAKKMGETDEDYKNRCSANKVEAIQCLQRAMEKGLNVPARELIKKTHEKVKDDPNYTEGPSNSTEEVDYDEPPPTPVPGASSGDTKDADESKTTTIVTVSVSVVLLLFVAAAIGLFIFYRRRKRRREEEEEDEEEEEEEREEESEGESRQLESSQQPTIATASTKVSHLMGTEVEEQSSSGVAGPPSSTGVPAGSAGNTGYQPNASQKKQQVQQPKKKNKTAAKTTTTTGKGGKGGQKTEKAPAKSSVAKKKKSKTKTAKPKTKSKGKGAAAAKKKK